EETLQHMHDELHGGVVVVQQQNLVEAGLLGLGPRLGDEARLALFITPRAVLAGHSSRSLSPTVASPRLAPRAACRRRRPQIDSYSSDSWVLIANTASHSWVPRRGLAYQIRNCDEKRPVRAPARRAFYLRARPMNGWSRLQSEPGYP